MLSSVPTREKKKTKNYTTIFLVGFIFVLVIALSGLSGLYYLATQTSPTVIVINQTANNTSTHQSQPVEDTTSTVDTQKNKQNTPTITNQENTDKKSNSKDSKDKRPNNST